jgi:type VI secretion system protein ImpA
MVIIDTEELLRAISRDAPCGQDLEYDADFLALERCAQSVGDERLVGPTESDVEPDWHAVAKLARTLLTRTKDLRVMMFSIKAAIRIGGLEEFAHAVSGLRALLEQYWDSVHPQLVVDGYDNSVQRINVLRELCDRNGVLAPLRNAPLVALPALGRFTFRDIALASGELTAPSPGADSTLPDMASIDAAFANGDRDRLRATTDALRSIGREVDAIQSSVNSRMTEENALDLGPLLELASRMLGAVLARVGDRLAPPEQATSRVTDGSAATSTAAAISTAMASGTAPQSIASRSDVVRVLERVCEYYDRCEPSSPVPILLRRAMRLAPMTFVDIVRELAPGGLSEVETIRGPEGAETR